MSEIDFTKLSNGFVSASESWDEEETARENNSKNIGSFGIPFLDDVFDGTETSDLIVCGGSSGRGKTQALTIIALANAMAGNHAYFYALEAEDHEILRRLKFILYMREYFNDLKREEAFELRFSQFRLNKYKFFFKKYDEAVKEYFFKAAKHLHVYYKTSSFCADDFVKSILEIENQADIILLDHINFLDLDANNENRALSDAVKAIRRVQIDCGVPIIMAAHVRKKSFNDERLLPSIEEFHGSSEIYKSATKAFMLAPCFDTQVKKTHLKTYIHAVKHRHDGTANRYVALTTFDIESNSYLDVYTLGTLENGGKKFTAIDKLKAPLWAAGHVNQTIENKPSPFSEWGRK